MAEPSLFAELKQRKVVQAALIYGAVAFGLTEVLVLIVDQLFLPQWIATLTVILFVVGFPIAMFLAWTFDFTTDGIQRTEIASRRGKASIAASVLLLLAGTSGVFFLIKPSLDSRPLPGTAIDALPNSIAVLPFDFSGPNNDDAYLGAGLSDELRDQLARITEIQIAARSSSIAAAESSMDAKDAALKLGVAHLLEGNMRRQGNVLRVSVQLVDGTTGLAVWHETFDRGRAELLSVQQEIAQRVLDALLPESTVVISAPITQNATANEKMLLARHYEQQVRGRETVDLDLLERTIRLYREAIELDPESALAHSRLAGALMYYGDIDAAEAPAYRALQLDPNLAEAQNTYGKFLFVRGRPHMGEPLARAVELNPNLPEALADYAWYRWVNIGEDGVAELYRRAVDLDPLNVGRYGALGVFLGVNGDIQEARDVIEQLQQLFDEPDSYRAIANIYEIVGDVDHAIAWTIKARDAEPGNQSHIEKLAEYYVDIGAFETAEEILPEMSVGLLFKMRRYDEMIEQAEDLIMDYPEDIQLRVHLASAYIRTGAPDLAIRLIRNSGLLDSIAYGWRGSEDFGAFHTLVDAAHAAGNIDDARALATGHLESHYGGKSSDWWVSLNLACLNAIIGDDSAVYERLQMLLGNNHLAWPPALRDASCFTRFQEDPAYLAVVDHFEGRQEMLRARLPATLASYGVAL